MKRREFIALLGGTAAWPLAARAQQPTLPVIGWLSTRTAEVDAPLLAAFRRGLGAAGYEEGKNAAIEFRFADTQFDQLPAMAADLVRRQVAVICAVGGNLSAYAARAATTTIPVVFLVAADPVENGLVASLNRPGGNLTGVTTLSLEVRPKALELLHEMVPNAGTVGFLINPGIPGSEQTVMKQMEPAALALGLQLRVLHASTDRELDTIFGTLAQSKVGALLINNDPAFTSRIERLASLTLRYAVPAVYQYREFVAAGGLMSYSGSRTEQYRIAGTYAGRILKGETPADLPVQQVTKIELIINLKTAKALGLTVPLTLQYAADEVIEQ